MRLWHIDLITNDLLPKSQLVAQWRELNSIFVKEDNHILINFIYDYNNNKEHLLTYANLVIESMQRQKINIRKMDNYLNYFKYVTPIHPRDVFYNEMNFEYLEICYFNLKEKFLRGQKDFSEELYNKIYTFCRDKKMEINRKKIIGGDN